MLRLLVISVLLGLALAATQDKTREAGASGSDLVKAVINLIRSSCVFPDDKLFLRRLAYVETKDGTGPDTYRPGYNGGIWKIDEDRFNQLKSNPKATKLFPAIQTSFAIDWSTVQWSDLKKPLYSGLAAALYLATVQAEVPRQLEKQGSFYHNNFNSANSAHYYYEQASKLKSACQRTSLDLAFLVDGSTSLSSPDFENAKQFARNVVDNFKIGSDDVRVAFVTFSDGYKSQFNFNDHGDKSSLQNAINAIQKPDGVTDTDAALDFASNTLFTAASGARDGTSKVILVLTDGKSSDTFKTAPAAKRARDKGIIIFSIGVGGTVDTQELTDIATPPACTHVITLAGYSDLSALVSQIQEVSCQAAAVLGPGTYTFPCEKGGLFQFETKGSNETVTISVSDGRVEIYGSLVNPTPSKAVNSFSSVSSTAAKSVILVSSELKPVYTTVYAPPDGCKGTFTIEVGKIKRVPPVTYVSCVENDRAKSCSPANIYGYLYTLLSPPYNFVNPCQAPTPEFRPHPTDPYQFLFCDRQGNVYLFQCAAHYHYQNDIYDCVPGDITTTTPVPTTTIRVTQPPATQGPYTNPCTEENRVAGKFFFPYPPDETKYIDCTNWPTLGYIKDCPEKRVWDQIDLTCTFKFVVVEPTQLIFSHVPNPCRNPLRDGDLFFFPHPSDPKKFIHCDAHGDAYEKDCPDKTFWNQKVLNCIPKALVIG